MKTLLFTCALPVELKIVKEKIKSLDLKGVKLDFLLSGVGNYNVIYNLKDYINKKGNPDFVVNFGVCGKSDETIKDDFFQVYRIKNSSNKRESLVPIYFQALDLRSILSSEEVVVEGSSMFGEIYVDMESYGVEYICNKEQIPCVIIKKPFDVVGEKSKSVGLVELRQSLENFDYENLINYIVEWLSKNTKNDILEKIDYFKNYFKFTFSETEIFKKNFNKFIAFTLDFEDFFEKNKTLNKKEFLEKMTNI
ncbi:MAG: hypothetical protein PHH06_02130 [Candidatus Gracilibacteria bacterium]|nr:hypothetical protein [Candidatus Gracilibacteria bacterium]